MDVSISYLSDHETCYFLKDVRLMIVGSLVLHRAEASRDADGTAFSGDYLDGRGDQPLGADLGSSLNPSIQSQFSHPALRDT